MEKHTQEACFRVDPESRLCPTCDATGIRKYHVATRKDMGVRVVDNFCEEHIQ